MDLDGTGLQEELTPQQRLEQTRHALAAQLARRRRRGRSDASLAERATAPARGFVAKASRTARLWWERHPVHDAVDFARPALEDYARGRPLQLVGIAAGTGAALTLLKSWHVLSLTGVALALLKSSDFKGMASSLTRPPAP